MIVLITGSNGFIGRAISLRMQKENYIVYEWSREGLFLNNSKIQSFAIEKPEDAEKVLLIAKPDIVMHCAGSADVNYSVQHPYEDLSSNYITTHNILFAMKKTGVTSRFVLFSSAAVYGNPVKLPMSEEEPIHPLSPYALHKRAAEEVCLYMNKNYHIDVKILRLFSVYGPGLKKQIFWDMHHKVKESGRLNLMGSGEESRDYIYIDDLVEAPILVALDEGRDIIYNIANGEETTIYKAAMTFAKYMKIPQELVTFSGRRREGDPINWCADITKLKMLGYKRKYSFEDGVGKYVDWLDGFKTSINNI